MNFTNSKGQLFASSLSPKPIRSSTQDETELKSRTSENNDDRIRLLNQLENFYLPFMKQIYSVNKQKLQGTVKPPDQLITTLKIYQQQFRDTDSKKRIQALKKDNETKELKIKELNTKVMSLYNQLKVIKPEEQINAEISNSFEQSEKKIKRLENLLKIKNEQVFFRLKVKAVNLLQQFQAQRSQIDGINQLDTENAVFQYLINKLKSKIKDIKTKQKQTTQQNYRQKASKEQYQEKLKYLSQTNELLKNNEKRNKQKLQQIKKEWKLVCQRLIWREKQSQERENQIYKYKKLLQEKETQILKLSSSQKTNTIFSSSVRKEMEAQLREMRAFINSYNIEINQLKNQLQEKYGEIEDFRIKNSFLAEQYQRMNRQYVRWKQRYQTLESQRQNRTSILDRQNSMYKQKLNQLEQSISKLLESQYNNKIQIEDLRKLNSQWKFQYDKLQSQFKEITTKCQEYQFNMNKSIFEIEQEYLKKTEEMKKIHQEHLLQIASQKDLQYRSEIKQLNQNWKKKLQLLEQNSQRKINNFQQSTQTKNSEQLLSLLEQNKLLKQKVKEKQKLLDTVYSNASIKTPTSAMPLTKSSSLALLNKKAEFLKSSTIFKK